MLQKAKAQLHLLMFSVWLSFVASVCDMSLFNTNIVFKSDFWFGIIKKTDFDVVLPLPARMLLKGPVSCRNLLWMDW